MRGALCRVWTLWALLAGCVRVPLVAAPPRSQDSASAVAVLWAGKPVSQLYEEGEVRAFRLTQDGHPLGTSWGRYLGTRPGQSGRHIFETRIELIVPRREPVRSEGQLVLDDEGALVEGFERSTGAELRFERQQDVLVFSDGQRRREVAYAPEEGGDAVMAHSAIFHEELMLGLRTLRGGPNQWRLVSLSGGPPTPWEGKVTGQAGALSLTTSLGEKVLIRDGRIERIEVDATALRIESVAAPWPEWTVVAPPTLHYTQPTQSGFKIRGVELAGKKGDPKLVGEVLVPDDRTLPRPGVLFVGAGLTDRYGFSMAPRVDVGSHQITDALARAGFVVLRFDERGHGESGTGEVSFLGQVEDARRAFRTLSVQDEVDPDRIVLVGHGEGGLRALHVAVGRQGVPGVALLACPGRHYRDVFVEQAGRALKTVPNDLRASVQADQAQMLAAIEGGTPPAELASQATWIREILVQKPAALIAGIHGSLFVAHGGEDPGLDAETEVTALVEAARRAHRPVHAARYPELDHNFKRTGDSVTADGGPKPIRPVDPALISDLVAWMQAVVEQPAHP